MMGGWPLGEGGVRTGIDLGAGSVKLVRGEGAACVQEITHAGIEPWDAAESGDEVGQAASALERLLRRLSLGRRTLGRIAAGAGGEQCSVREVTLPPLSEAELRRALPYEAKKHLFLEGMETPCLDVQILGPAPVEADEGGSDHIRVLFAAAPLSRRDLPIRALERAGLAPEVVDLEALAGLNAALATLADQGEPLNGHSGFGVLDLGSRATVLHATHTAGGVLSRSVGPTLPRSGAPGEMAPLLARIAGEVHETFMFFRGRYRRGLSRLYLAGGGARVVGVAERLSSHLNLPVEVLDPLAGRSGIAGDADAVRDDGPRFVTAFGLCRWWDAPHV